MGRPRKLSSTECREAVLCLLRREETAEAIGRRLGVNQSTVSRWRDEFLADGEAGPHDRRVAVMRRRAGQAVKDRLAYTVMRAHGLLQQKKTRRAEVHYCLKDRSVGAVGSVCGATGNSNPPLAELGPHSASEVGGVAGRLTGTSCPSFTHLV